MPDRFTPSLALCALAVTLLLSACKSTPTPLYQEEAFDATGSPYAHTFQAGSNATCEAARRALLSQGYMASATQPVAIDGSKNFQPNNDSHIVIEFHVVCVDANGDGTTSTAYVNAVQDRYTLKKSNTSASVGLSVLGSLSLPIGSSDDSLVKVASETIPAGVFYERYFKLVDHFLKIDPVHSTRATVAKAEQEPVAPLPVPAPTPQGEPMRLKTPDAPEAPASQPVAVPPGSTAAPAPVASTEPASVPPAASAAVATTATAPIAPTVPANVPPAVGTTIAAAIPAPVASPERASASAAASAAAAVVAAAPAMHSEPASAPSAASATTVTPATAPAPAAPSEPTSAPSAASTAAPAAAASDTSSAH
jgi:hypothetical protein